MAPTQRPAQRGVQLLFPKENTNMKTLNRSDLCQALADDTGLPFNASDRIVKSIFVHMADALHQGDHIELTTCENGS